MFTDEFDQWWGNGPIDAWDSGRVIENRFEPGTGDIPAQIFDQAPARRG